MKIVILLISLFSVSSFAENDIEKFEQMRFRDFSTKTEAFQKMTISEEGMNAGGSVHVSEPTEKEESQSTKSMEDLMKQAQESMAKPDPKNTVRNNKGMPVPGDLNNPLAPPNMSPEELKDYQEAIKNVQERHKGSTTLTNDYINDAFGEIEKIQNKHKPK